MGSSEMYWRILRQILESPICTACNKGPVAYLTSSECWQLVSHLTINEAHLQTIQKTSNTQHLTNKLQGPRGLLTPKHHEIENLHGKVVRLHPSDV